MAKNPQKPVTPTKKHLARMQREKRQRRLILISSAIVLAVVIGVIIFGILNQTVLQARQPVALVDGTKITTRQWQAQTRFYRSSLIRSAENTIQFLQLFGNDPTMQAQFVSQLQQIQSQLDPETVGKQVIDELVNLTILRKEAEKLGITVSEQEIDTAFEEALGYYAKGTPTTAPTVAPVVTSTLSPLQMTLAAPTETPTPTATPLVTQTVTATLSVTATPTLTPTPAVTETPTATEVLTPTVAPTAMPTPTPFTLDAYQDVFEKTLDDYKTRFGVGEKDLRYVLEAGLLRQKLEDVVLKDIQRIQPYVWARHILVDSEEKANEVRTRYQAGESFCKLASEFSTDTGSKDSCGDLGWFSKGRMVAEFEDAAFKLNVGEISKPVKSQFGYHVILSLGKEDRALSDSEYQQLRQTKFQEWLDQVKAKYTIEIKDIWTKRVPTEPTLPPEILQFIQSASQGQQNPLAVTPAP